MPWLVAQHSVGQSVNLLLTELYFPDAKSPANAGLFTHRARSSEQESSDGFYIESVNEKFSFRCASIAAVDL